MKSFQKYKEFLTKSTLDKVVERLSLSIDAVFTAYVIGFSLNFIISIFGNIGFMGLLLFNSFVIAPICWLIFFNKESKYVKTKEECLTAFNEVVSNQENQKVILSFFVEARDLIKAIADTSESEKKKAIENKLSFFDQFVNKISSGQFDKECMHYFYRFHSFLMDAPQKKVFEELNKKVCSEEYIRKIMSSNDVSAKETIHEKEMEIGEHDNFKIRYKL